MKRLLVVAPHADDETLGCGGTLLRLRKEGWALDWLLVTSMSRESGQSDALITQRAREIDVVAKAFAFERTHQLGLPTTRLDAIPFGDVVAAISRVVSERKPELLLVPNRSDSHSDHRVAFDATMACVKSFRHPYIKKVLMYETLSETETAPALAAHAFLPTTFFDVSSYLSQKARIFARYAGEGGRHPFPRSEETIRALAMLRGSMAGCRYAEAFQLVKEIY